MDYVRRPAAALALLVILLSACGPLATPTPTPVPPTVQPTTPPATLVLPTNATPADTLRWSLDGISNLEILDPARPGGLPSVTVLSLVFGGLVRLDDQMEVQPDGASDWEVSADGKIYTFTIREGLTFADGTSVTAEDWAYSINRALAPETASYGASAQLSHIVGARDVIEKRTKTASGVRVLDPRRLEITLDAPLAYFLSQLAYPYTYVVPRSLVERSDNWASEAYGTGPYRVESIVANEGIRLVANERYWRGKPGVPKIYLPFNLDSATSYQQYRAGELDIMGSWQSPVPSALVAEAQQLPGFQTAAILATRYIGFNNQLAPFDNVDVRRAFALAIDKQKVVDQTLRGNGIAADRILPTGLIGSQIPIVPLAFNPQAARDALAAAGYPGGQGLPPITLAYAIEGDNKVVTEMLVAMWQEHLDVVVQLKPLDLDTFSKGLDTTYRTPADGLQMYYSIWGADYPDPHNFLSQQLRSDTANNNGHFSDAQFDRLVNEADQLGDRSQIERRLQLYVQAEQIAIDKVGWLPLFYPEFNSLLNPRVEGLVITPNGLIAQDWTKVRLK
ncbi:MAG: peptide ABC transporter substrate-binding protein [Roseiflexaceae bacterium]